MKRPSLREVTRMVRETHEAWSHPDAGAELATLAVGATCSEIIIATDEAFNIFSAFNDYADRSEHAETLGDTSYKLDAVAVARRLIAGLPR